MAGVDEVIKALALVYLAVLFPLCFIRGFFRWVFWM